MFGKKKELIYKNYIKDIKNQNFYCCCSKCSRIKVVKTCFDKWGADYYSQTEKYKENFKLMCLNKYGFENPSQIEKFKEKRKNTMRKKYGVDYYVLSKDFLEKSKETSLINYGTPHPMMSDKMKEIKQKYYLENGFNVLTDEFEIYKGKVYGLTRKIKKDLMKNWDGRDYYDNEFIKDNFDLPYHHKNYPTIDHKTSIFEGFENKIPAEDIAHISNLCFTKRCVNSKKYLKNDFDFIF